MANRSSYEGRAFGRRAFLRGLAGAAAAGKGLVAGAAFAQAPSFGRHVPRSEAGVPTFGPQTVQMTEQVIPRYDAIAAQGGWPAIQPGGVMQPGLRHQAVAALRQRLIIEGDLDQGYGVSDVYDSAVEQAVRSFQFRHGIGSDGVVREQTFAALNVPAHIRASQLRTNLVRLRTMGGNLGSRYVLCNLPATQIETVENGYAVARYTTVVGKPDRPSPDIQSRIVEINFNPFWTVPASIVRRDLIPKMQAEPDYLTKNRIRILDANGYELSPAQINWYSTEATNYRFKQDPGDFNSLGSIRINFPSAHGVYMHDTPYKNLFGEDFRFHSSGCIRVQNIHDLAAWLLSETPGWSPADIDHTIRSGERRDARMARPVPLYWVYLTAWVTDGVVQFRDDIYNRDGAGSPYAASRG